MQGYGYLYIKDYAVSMSGVGTLTIDIPQIASVTMSGTGSMSVYAAENYGYALFPAISAFGGEFTTYGEGNAKLPALESYAEGGLYVPTLTNYGLGIIAPLVSTGFLHTVSYIDGDGNIPALAGKGGEGEYGEGDGSLAALTSLGIYGTAERIAPINNIMIALNGIGTRADYIVFISNTGTITDTISGSKVYIESLIASMEISDSYSVLGTFLVSMSEDLSIADYFMVSVGDGTSFAPALDRESRVWVVNIDTAATSQYDNYGYKSFYSYDGKNYGVAEDGIYELTGDDDSSINIDALVDFGRTDLGTRYKKRVTSAYLGVGSDGKLALTVEADGQSYTFEANTSSTLVSKNRINMGSALSGYYWNLVLTNNDGYDIDLDSIMLEITKLNRRL